MLDNLKTSSLAMKNDVHIGHHGHHGANALLHVVEESKLERVNAQKRIDVLGIMKMLISVAETNAVSISISLFSNRP